jgi:hypothetical protein
MNKLDQEYQQRLQDELEKTPFPAQYIHPTFRHWLSLCLPHVPPYGLKCHWETYKKIKLEEPNTFNLHAMGMAINAIVLRRQAEIKFTDQHYIEMMDATSAMSAMWHSIVGPIQKKIARQVQALARIKPANA